MPLTMVKVSYTAQGIRGVLKEGGTARVDAVTKAVEGVGGKVHGFWFALGEDDAFVVVEVPDITDGIAISMAVAASGIGSCTSVPLLTPAQIDEATRKAVAYSPPQG